MVGITVTVAGLAVPKTESKSEQKPERTRLVSAAGLPRHDVLPMNSHEYSSDSICGTQEHDDSCDRFVE